MIAIFGAIFLLLFDVVLQDEVDDQRWFGSFISTCSLAEELLKAC